jgi:hypothetical protein
MVDPTGETVPCQFCDIEIEVPTERSRFAASIEHFEAEHVHRPQAPPGTEDRVRTNGPTPSPAGAEGDAGEESGVGD